MIVKTGCATDGALHSTNTELEEKHHPLHTSPLKCAVQVHDVEFCHSLRQLVDHTIPALRELKEGTHSVTLYT